MSVSVWNGIRGVEFHSDSQMFTLNRP